MNTSFFEKMYRRYAGKIVLFACALLLCACSAKSIPVAHASQPTPTRVAAPVASPTPLSVSLPATPSPTPRPPSRTPTPNAALQETQLLDALQQGGYVIYIHSGDGEGYLQNLEDCSQQTTLSKQGQIEVRSIGLSVLALGIPIGEVLHSASCSSFDTAMLAFGLGKNWSDRSKTSISLRGERIAALRKILSTKPEPGTNNMIVGHGLDITDVTGARFEEHEAAIFKPLGKAGYAFVTRISPSQWKELNPKAASQVQVEPYAFDSVPLEQAGPTPATPLRATPEGESGLNGNSGAGRSLMLPDLATLKPTDLRIRTNPADGHKLLRFTNSIVNHGPGKMELWGDTNPDGGNMTVIQHIYDTAGSAEKRVVGEFLFHPEHNHWHLGDFARYEIWSIGIDGRLDSVVAVSNKISYCLRDDALADIPDAASRQAYIMCNHERQGISVGWIDIYRYHLPGQSVDITFLGDGIYALRSTVNPENRLWEENQANNTAILYIQIEGDRVRAIESQELNKLFKGQY